MDDREKDPEFIDALLFHADYPVTFQRMPVGDIGIGGRWVIERKTTADFWQSWKSRVLDDEIYRLVEAGHKEGWWIALLVEQTADLELDIMTRISKHCQTLNFILPVIHSSGVKDTIYRIGHLAQKCQDQLFDYLRRPATIIPSTPDPRLAVLMGFPGIDEVRAEVWLRHFGSLQGCLENLDKITDVKGIGKKISHDITTTWVKKVV